MDFILEQEENNFHSLLVIRNGYIVLDASFYPYAPESLHDVASVTKSVTSTLVGIAIGKGYIQNIHQPVLSFFPDHQIANLSTEKEAITLEDLLTMRSGLECISEQSEETTIEMITSPDWVQFTLDLPMVTEPGTTWEYCSPGSHLLAAIVQQATGTNTMEFAQKYLFKPLGISNVIWPEDPQGIVRGQGDLRLTPHDIAKIGYLYLNNGMWENEQILPSSWVAEATSIKPNLDFYGYQWWLFPEESYYKASGRGGQAIYVIPDENLIVVVTGNGQRFSDTLLESFLLPAISASSPLPANPDGIAALQARVKQAVEPPLLEPEPVPPSPDIAHTVSGQTYLLEDNAFGLTTISLSFPAADEAQLSFTASSGSPFGDEEYSWLIGLDNIPRIHPGRFDINAAASGAWIDKKTFEAHVDEIGNNIHWLLRLVFENDQVSLFMADSSAALPPMTFIGSLDTTKIETVSTGVMVTVRMDLTRLNSGPGEGYPQVGILERGDFIDVIGRNEAGDWLEISSETWVPTSAVNVVGDDISTLPVVEVSISPEEAFNAQWEAAKTQAFSNPPANAEATLQHYVGRYELYDFISTEPYSVTIFIEDGILKLEASDQVVTLKPANETRFVIDQDRQVEFSILKDGGVLMTLFFSDGKLHVGQRYMWDNVLMSRNGGSDSYPFTS